ncbi:unnamed protein product [Calicophoron daubneyi]|uniref:DnaJ homolog subfamily C member 16 n=1 Tax=Calicophoron daubneyi TaxID=300641 RepID=A0AAV2T896_CALDB
MDVRGVLMTSYAFWLLFVGLVLLVNADYYDVLGVSRSASQAEIRNAYRRLARQWHPDKNPSKEASQKFIELNQAYEVLSNVNKRREYDTFKTVSGDTNFDSSGRHQFRYKFVHSPFEDLFDIFPQFSRRRSFSANVLEIDFRSYRMTHLPRSRSVPLLIMGYSDFCLHCQRAHVIWSQLADELTPLGVSVCVVNLERDPSMRDELHLHHVPSIVLVIDGQVSYYTRGEYSHNSIIDTLRTLLIKSNPSRSKALPSFLSTTLDTPLVQMVRDYSTFINDFHPGWRRDSRPRMLLFKPLVVPSLRYIVAAFRAADHLAAGFVNSESPYARQLVDKFHIPQGEESLLIFHEDPERPVSFISEPKLSPEQLDEAMLAYSQLTIPRIYSTARLLDLCPADGSEPASAYASASEMRSNDAHNSDSMDHRNHRHFCLLLLLHSKIANLERTHGHAEYWLSMLRQVDSGVRRELQKMDSSPVRNHFQTVHVYADRQASWLERLSHDQTLDKTEQSQNLADPGNIGRLALLWRITSKETALYMFPVESNANPRTQLPLESPLGDKMNFSANLGNMERDLIAELVSAITPLSGLTTTAFLDSHRSLEMWHTTSDFMVENFVMDELAVPMWLRIRRKLWGLLSQASTWLAEFVTEPVSFVLSTTVIMLGLFVYSLSRLFVQAATNDVRRTPFHADDPPAAKNTRPSSATDRSNAESRPNRNPREFKRFTPSVVLSLNSLTYDKLVLSAPKGHQLLVLCVRGGGSPQDTRLCAQFASKTGHVGPRVQCAQLSMTRYAGWLAKLLEYARSGMPVRVRTPEDEEGSPSGYCERLPGTVYINPSNCIGTVIAINGSRRYFSLYHPLLPGTRSSSESSIDGSKSDSDPEAGPMDGEPQAYNHRGVRKRRIFGHVLGLDSDDEAELDGDSPQLRARHHVSSGALFDNELLDGLPNWLDRLFEGSLTRYQVDEWPINLRGET